MARPRFRIRYADVAATLALVIACGGTAYAAGALPRDSVGTPQLQDGAVTTAKLHRASVTSGKLARGSVRSATVANGSITLKDLAGADLTGTAALFVSPGSCGQAVFGVTGAKVGQVAVLDWTGTSVPALASGPATVTSAGHVTVVLCNLGDTSVTVTDLPVRVITLD
jgi:hypothetical protein